jgi:AcrR family transcriptional regulator
VSPTRSLRPDEQRRRLVEIAVDHIADAGFEHYSLERIAETAGVSRMQLYRYFPRARQDVDVAVVEFVMEELALGQIVNPELPPDDRRLLNMERFARHAFGDTAEWRVYRQAVALPDPEISDLLEDFHARWIRLVAENNDVDAEDPWVFLGLRSLIEFACIAAAESRRRRLPQAEVLSYISRMQDDILVRSAEASVASNQTVRSL